MGIGLQLRRSNNLKGSRASLSAFRSLVETAVLYSLGIETYPRPVRWSDTGRSEVLAMTLRRGLLVRLGCRECDLSVHKNSHTGSIECLRSFASSIS